MGMRTWAALRTPVGTKAEFEFRPQDLKGQVSDLLSCLYNPANWRAAVIRLSATAIFSSVPQLETFSFPRHLSRLDAVYEITGMERTCFSPQEQTQPEIFILLADCTEWMGSSSPNKQKWAGTEWGCECCSLRAVSAPGSCCKLPRLPKALKRVGCHPQLSSLLSCSVAASLVTCAPVQLCDATKTPWLWAVPQEHCGAAHLPSATAHCTAPLHCLHNRGSAF